MGCCPTTQARWYTLVHDCWASYWSLQCTHSLCGAHLLRELIYQKKTTAQAWPQGLIELLLAAEQACKAARQADTALQSSQLEAFASQYRALVQEGQAQNLPAAKVPGQRGRAKQSGAFNLLRRLLEPEQEVLRFMRDLGVPFTNNLAERAIRMPKVRQTISGCFRALPGAQNFCTIRSYLDTARKQGFGMLARHARRLLGTDPGTRVGLNSHEKSTVTLSEVACGMTVRPCLVSLTKPYWAIVCSDLDTLGACLPTVLAEASMESG